MDARENELPLAILRPEGRGPASYPGLGVRGTPKMLRQWSVRNQKFRIRGFYYVWAYIPHALSEESPGRALGRTGRIGPRPVSRRAVGIAENSGDEVAGGGSHPWTPRRQHERAREMALGTAWAARCPI
ncbi:hypothetical protein CRG98_040423 [Punica granatum]|uniref:Uncharacterized protein n=1 Tax=Punica granatum TaxID=22663 RepID=A0A2I0I6Y5_PUNGR|nr:hypothetical protein CRG98_040423 [Punica granatum]